MRRLLLIPALWTALALPAGAQCVMCYRTAKSQNEARSHVMNAGILILASRKEHVFRTHRPAC